MNEIEKCVDVLSSFVPPSRKGERESECVRATIQDELYTRDFHFSLINFHFI